MKLRNPLRGIKLVRRRSSPVTQAAVLAAVVLSTVALVLLYGSIQSNCNQYEAMRQQAAILEEANKQLDIRIDQADTVEGIELIAAEQLGLVNPDTIVFDPAN